MCTWDFWRYLNFSKWSWGKGEINPLAPSWGQRSPWSVCERKAGQWVQRPGHGKLAKDGSQPGLVVSAGPQRELRGPHGSSPTSPSLQPLGLSLQGCEVKPQGVTGLCVGLEWKKMDSGVVQVLAFSTTHRQGKAQCTTRYFSVFYKTEGCSQLHYTYCRLPCFKASGAYYILLLLLQQQKL